MDSHVRRSVLEIPSNSTLRLNNFTFFNFLNFFNNFIKIKGLRNFLMKLQFGLKPILVWIKHQRSSLRLLWCRILRLKSNLFFYRRSRRMLLKHLSLIYKNWLENHFGFWKLLNILVKQQKAF